MTMEYRPVLQNIAYELTMVKGLTIDQICPPSPIRCIISNDKERFSLRIPVFLNDSLKGLTLYVTDASACIVHRNE